MVRFALCCLAFATALLVTTPGRAQQPDAVKPSVSLAPLLDEQAFAVVRIDLARVDLAAARKMLVDKLPMISPASLEEQEAQVSKWIEALREAGVLEVYVVASLADVPGQPPFGTLRLAKESKAARASQVFLAGPGDGEQKLPIETAVIDGQLCFGSAPALARLKEQMPVVHEDLDAAFALAGDAAIQAILLQSTDSRRVLAETLPALPGALKEYSGKDLATIQFAALGLDFSPHAALRIGVQTTSDVAATRLQQLLHTALAQGEQQDEIKQLFPKYAELVKLLTPKQTGDRLTLVLTEEDGGITSALSLLTPPLQAARKAAQRAQSMNHLKQLGLAMHLYHDATRTFPPAATTKEGKALLSWRVEILPYIEQGELYKQFHHDEPWDSEHNQKLVEKMPQLFATPAADLKPGHTTYLVPTGKGLVFDGGKKTVLSEITDGSSNTIMIVEANADRAVPWTKPDDLAVDVEKPHDGLGHIWRDGFLAGFCDGSVRFIPAKVDAKTLRHLFEMADGNPIDEF